MTSNTSVSTSGRVENPKNWGKYTNQATIHEVTYLAITDLRAFLYCISVKKMRQTNQAITCFPQTFEGCMRWILKGTFIYTDMQKHFPYTVIPGKSLSPPDYKGRISSYYMEIPLIKYSRPLVSQLLPLLQVGQYSASQPVGHMSGRECIIRTFLRSFIQVQNKKYLGLK